MDPLSNTSNQPNVVSRFISLLLPVHPLNPCRVFVDKPVNQSIRGNDLLLRSMNVCLERLAFLTFLCIYILVL